MPQLESVRRFADAGLDPSELGALGAPSGRNEPDAATVIFGVEGAPAMLALIRRVDRLEELQSA